MITFCGHSDIFDKEIVKDKLLHILEEKIDGQDVEFLVGNYGSFDTIASVCAKAYKTRHQNCKLTLVTPYIDIYRQKNRLNDLNEYYDEIVYPPLESAPYKFAIILCNQWMVEQSDCVIAYVDCHWG